MSVRRRGVLMFAALAAIAGAFYLSAQRDLARDSRGTALLPNLASELNSVSSVSVLKGGSTPAVTVHRSGDRWTVEQRGDYPADVAKLRKLLVALSETKILEEKTANPDNYAALGVADPAAAGATGGEITWMIAGHRHELIVGKSAGGGTFVRRPAEARSYLIEPALSLDAQPRSWIDTRLIDVPAAVIQSIAVKFADGTGYALHRSSPAQNAFALEAVPPGRSALEPAALAPSPTLLAGLTADDVSADDAEDFANAAVATITTSDGGVITLTGIAAAGKHWIKVESSKDAALAARAKGRAFAIAGYRYDAIFRPLEQLLVAKIKPPAAKRIPAAKSQPHP